MSDTKPVLVIDGNVVGDVFQNATEDYVEVTASSGDTFGALLNELFALIDITKVNKGSVLKIGSDVYNIRRLQSSVLIFSGFRILSTNAYYESAYIESSESSLYLATYTKSSGNWNIEEETEFEVVSGTKVTLYYGNKTSQVDLTTYANKCMMSDGGNVEEFIDQLGIHSVDYIPLGKGWNGHAYTFIPLPHADKYTITLRSVTVYAGGPSGINITSSATVGYQTRDGFVINIPNNTYVGECIRLSFVVS